MSSNPHTGQCNCSSIKKGLGTGCPICKPEQHGELARLKSIEQAAIKLIKCKGRFHTEQNMRALAALLGIELPHVEPEAAKAQGMKPFECFSIDDGCDHWVQCPDDADIVDGKELGEKFELMCGWYAVRREYVVTKVPDDTSDDYEVEPVLAAPQAPAAPVSDHIRDAAQMVSEREGGDVFDSFDEWAIDFGFDRNYVNHYSFVEGGGNPDLLTLRHAFKAGADWQARAARNQPAAPVSAENAAQVMESKLWEFIDIAAASPSIKPDSRVFSTLQIYLPKEAVPVSGHSEQPRNMVSERELPPLPKAVALIDQDDDHFWGELQDAAFDLKDGLSLNDPLFSSEQMRGYARAALNQPAKHASAEDYMRDKYGAYRGSISWRKEIEAFEAGQSSSKPATPEGMAIVPIKSTLKIRKAMANVDSGFEPNYSGMWDAGIAAAQEGK